MGLKVNGTDYNEKVVSTLNLKEFKTEGKHSFCKDKTDEEIEAIFNQIKSVTDGNDSRNEEKGNKPEGKGSKSGK